LPGHDERLSLLLLSLLLQAVSGGLSGKADRRQIAQLCAQQQQHHPGQHTTQRCKKEADVSISLFVTKFTPQKCLRKNI
jgi:hypothetical protein